MSVHGQVVDPDGRPLAGARVVLRVLSQRITRELGAANADDVLTETRADQAGRFAFEDAPLTPSMSRIVEALNRGQRGADVAAMADGFGLGWTPLFAFSTDGVTIALQPAAALEGMVVDDAARPVVGADVEVVNISALNSHFDGFVESIDEFDLVLSSLRPNAVTDAEGRFRISGLPADHRLDVWVRHGDFAPQYLAAAIGEHAAPRPLLVDGEGGDEIPVHVTPVKVKLARGPRLVVHVADQRGRPAGGGRLTLGSYHEGIHRVPADGTVHVTVASLGDWPLIYEPRADQLAVSLRLVVSLADADVSNPKEIDLRLPEAHWLEGRVVVQGTELGAPGVSVLWRSDSSNAAMPGITAFSRAVAAQDGRFRMPALAGAGRVSAQGVPHGFFIIDRQTAREAESDTFAMPVDVPEVGAAAPLRLEVSQGLVVKGRVLTPQRLPAGGITVRGLSTARYDLVQQVAADAEGRFVMTGFDPREGCLLSAVGEGLVALQRIAPAKDHPFSEPRPVEVELALEPAVTLSGKVSFNGQPSAGIRLTLQRAEAVPDGTRMHDLANAVTGDDGSYRLCGLKGGDSYHIDVKPLFPAVDPEWRHQSPWIPKLPDDASGEVSLPGINLRRMNQSLAGVVVDPDGKPVAGATVSPQSENGFSLFHTSFGPPPWTKTDRYGRFDLSCLPDMPLDLMVYMEPEGENMEIRYPATAKTRIGQQDVRIVLDPSLAEEE